MSNISKIKISGTSYDLKDENACNVVELTQAEYDALPASAKTSNSLFVITDAQGADLSNYYTKSETSGATEISTALNAKADTATTYTKTEVDTALASKQTTLTAGDGIDITNDVISVTGKADTSAVTESINAAVSGKVDTSTFNTYSGSVDTALSGKQDTLSAGTGIEISGNVISATGGGGGKAVSAGTNISITTGETADTINCTLPFVITSNNQQSVYLGNNNDSYSSNSIILGSSSYANSGSNNILVGTTINSTGGNTLVVGQNLRASNNDETAFGFYNISTKNNNNKGDSGNTLFSVGNGYYKYPTEGYHNALEIRQNGDIYIADTNDTTYQNFYEKPMIKLQDNLGGGGASYSAGTGIDITNNVISVSGVVETSAITTSISSSSTDAQVPSAKAVYDIVGDIETLLSQI